MQNPPIIDETLKELDLAAELVNAFAVRAKRYWMGWGPVVGMPMILTIEAWAEGQRWYLEWLRAEVLNLGQTLLDDEGEEASANRLAWPSRLSTPYPPNLHPRLSDPFPPNIRRRRANLVDSLAPNIVEASAKYYIVVSKGVPEGLGQTGDCAGFREDIF